MWTRGDFMMETKKKEPCMLVCECGISVKGLSEKHAQSNLKAHKKSKIHKDIMSNKK